MSPTNHCTYATWNLQVRRFMEDVNIRRRFPCPSLNLDIKNWYNSWRNLLHLSNWSSKGRKLIFLSDVITVVVTGNSGSVIVDCEQPLGMVVCYTAVFKSSRNAPAHLWGGAFRDDAKNGCVADYQDGHSSKEIERSERKKRKPQGTRLTEERLLTVYCESTTVRFQ